MTKPPLPPESGYPSHWPALASLGPGCSDLDGTYTNEGSVIDGKGKEHSMRLTNLLPLDLTVEPETVSLKVGTRKRDPHGDTFATLQITWGDGKGLELGDCFCIKQTFFLKAREAYEALPVFGLAGRQCNIWLTKSTDGSLIAKVWNYSAGYVTIVPFYRQAFVYARFGNCRPSR